MTDKNTAPYTTGPQVIGEDLHRLNVVIVGTIGSGKSYSTKSGYVEPLLEARRRVVIIDPTGVWWGLRFKPDGAPGYPVIILGGLYGDKPMTAADGKAAARYVAQTKAPVILDVSEMNIGDRHTWATDFFIEIFQRNRHALHMIVDEADEMAPQNPMPETRRMLHHFDRIVRRGRTRGFRVAMLTQRPAVLHKNVLSQAKVMIAMMLMGSQDRDAVKLWIKGQGDLETGNEVLKTLPQLQTGEGWLWSPSTGVLNRGRFPLSTTFDSMRTPGDDEPAVEPPGPFPFDLSDELASYKSTPTPEEEDTQEEAKRSGKKAEAIAGPTPQAIDALVAQAFSDGETKARVIAAEWRREAHRRFIEWLQELDLLKAHASELIQSITMETTAERETRIATSNAIDKIERVVKPQARPQIRKMLEEALTPPAAPARRNSTSINREALQPALARILDAIPAREDMTWRGASIESGVTYGNGDWHTYKRALLEQKLVVEGDTSIIWLTDLGLDIADIGGAKTLGKLVKDWSEKLDSRCARILEALRTDPDEIVSLKQLASDAGITYGNGDWHKSLRSLTSNGLIERHGRSDVRLSEYMRTARRRHP